MANDKVVEIISNSQKKPHSVARWLAAVGEALDLMGVGRVTAALEILLPLVEHHPRALLRKANHRQALARALVAAGRCQLELDQVEAGTVLIERALGLDRNSAHVYCELGHSYWRAGRCGDALRCFQHATELDPTYTRAHLGLARCLDELDRRPEAIRACRRALAVDPDCKAVYLELARLHQKLEQLPQAITMMRRLIRRDPKDPGHHLALAALCRELGMLQEASKALEAAIKTHPNSPELCTALAEVYHERGMHDQVVAQAERMLRINPRNPCAHDLLAMGQFHKGNLDQAIETITRLIYLDPREPHHHFKLGMLLQHRGEPVRAMSEYLRVFETTEDIDLAQSAWEAIERLDQYQIQQLLLRATEDRRFREQLMHNPDETVRNHGFLLSEAALSALRGMDLDTPGESSEGVSEILYH